MVQEYVEGFLAETTRRRDGDGEPRFVEEQCRAFLRFGFLAKVSRGSGAQARELFFLGEGATLMATPVADGGAGVPVALFRTRVPVTGNEYRFPYRVSPDGQRFLINTTPEVVVRPAIHIVLDWRALLRK